MRVIDADVLIEKLDAEPEGGYYSPHDVISLLMTQPVVEKRKKSEWIKMPYHVTECSECGFSLEDWIQGAFYNYCPNCGADMRGDDHATD